MIIVVVSFEIAIVVAILPILPRVVVGVLDSIWGLGSGGLGEAGAPLVLQESLGVVCGEASVEREIVVGRARLHEGEGGSHWSECEGITCCLGGFIWEIYVDISSSTASAGEIESVHSITAGEQSYTNK